MAADGQFFLSGAMPSIKQGLQVTGVGRRDSARKSGSTISERKRFKAAGDADQRWRHHKVQELSSLEMA